MDSELGAVVDLMSLSPVHQSWTVADMQRLVVPPIELHQRVFVVDQGSLVGWGSWAFLSDEAEQGFISGSRKLRPEDWSSGSKIWLIDAIAPHGHAREITSMIRKTLCWQGHAGEDIRFRRNKDGLRRYARVML